jgi:protein tyrosine phosphatase (PTP) superfamily phosphohydrolase (DUF442 family)
MSNREFIISKITEYLFISAWPLEKDADKIKELGIRMVLSMNWMKPNRKLGEPPLELIWLPTFDSPFIPIPMRVLKRGVSAALPVIERGEAVLSHCRAGRHRSVAMASAVLIANDYSAQQAMELIKQKRPIADPNMWYIKSRIKKFERYWSEKRIKSPP